jgi:hypothetical protein
LSFRRRREKQKEKNREKRGERRKKQEERVRVRVERENIERVMEPYHFKGLVSSTLPVLDLANNIILFQQGCLAKGSAQVFKLCSAYLNFVPPFFQFVSTLEGGFRGWSYKWHIVFCYTFWCAAKNKL